MLNRRSFFHSVLKMMFLAVKSILKEKMEPAPLLLPSLLPWLIHISRDHCSKSGGTSATFHPFNSIYCVSTPCQAPGIGVRALWALPGKHAQPGVLARKLPAGYTYSSPPSQEHREPVHLFLHDKRYKGRKIQITLMVVCTTLDALLTG